MIRNTACFSILLLMSSAAFAQKGKVQAAWRALTDYEVTATEGKPDLSFLNKAKDAIDLALIHEDTKNKGKTHAYKSRISYAQFQYDLEQELKRLEPTVTDKNERLLTAYGNLDLKDFETASSEIVKVKDLDPKYMDNINEGLAKGSSMLDEDDAKFALVAQKVKIEAGNIATGKYKVKKYEEAAEYFYKTAVINSVLFKVKDTADFYNACIAASKSKNNDKMLEYNKKMIDAGIPIAYNYQAISNVYLSRADTTLALETLKKGRAAYPGDAALLTEETNIYLAKGLQQEALTNLKQSIEKDPKNAYNYLMVGSTYDNLANPKDKVTGKDLAKPANFDDYYKGAESSYLKAIDLSSDNKDYLSVGLRNLGALYNNYGKYMEDYRIEKITDVVKYQKENQIKSQEYYKKAIPYLEKSLVVSPGDQQTMSALRILYLKTGDEAKAKEMSDKIKNSK